jgi:hypothetical protein
VVGLILNRLKNLKKNQSGSTIVLVSITLISLLAMTGLVIDGGNLYLTKSSLQKTANAAVLSGAQELVSTEDKVKQIVREVLQAHSEDGSLQDEDLDIQMGNKVSVDLKRDVPLAFSKIFGKDSVQVEVHAAARIGVMGRAEGVAPIGIDETKELIDDQVYTLKYKDNCNQSVDGDCGDYGWFGALNLGGTGAELYKKNLMNGYQNELEVGDIITAETGIMKGPTQYGVEPRFLECPEDGTNDEVDRDCERIILIPIYTTVDEDLDNNNNQVKEVKITGFAYFLLVASDAKEIKAKYMGDWTGTGFEDSTAVNKGAYSIRLAE